MLKFLRKIQKGFKRACLTAAVVTCWQVGQAANAGIVQATNSPGDITIKFSGTINPTVKNISHLFLIYGTGSSSIDGLIGIINLGDFPAGQTTEFSFFSTAPYVDQLYWHAAGLYGDISSGQYIDDGTNGVALGINPVGGTLWEQVFWGWMTEQRAFDNILNDTPQNMYEWYNGFYLHNLNTDGDYTNSSILYDFSQGTNNGQIQFNAEVVPEPVSMVLLGTGGMIVVALRRRT